MLRSTDRNGQSCGRSLCMCGRGRRVAVGMMAVAELVSIKSGQRPWQQEIVVVLIKRRTGCAEMTPEYRTSIKEQERMHESKKQRREARGWITHWRGTWGVDAASDNPCRLDGMTFQCLVGRSCLGTDRWGACRSCGWESCCS